MTQFQRNKILRKYKRVCRQSFRKEMKIFEEVPISIAKVFNRGLLNNDVAVNWIRISLEINDVMRNRLRANPPKLHEHYPVPSWCYDQTDIKQNEHPVIIIGIDKGKRRLMDAIGISIGISGPFEAAYERTLACIRMAEAGMQNIPLSHPGPEIVPLKNFKIELPEPVRFASIKEKPKEIDRKNRYNYAKFHKK